MELEEEINTRKGRFREGLRGLGLNFFSKTLNGAQILEFRELISNDRNVVEGGLFSTLDVISNKLVYHFYIFHEVPSAMNNTQSIPTTAAVGEVEKRELWWTARLLHRSVVAHDDATIKRGVAEWEAAPRCFPLGNPNGAGITMGSSPRFPMYEGNDFGWGGPVAVRSGRANKFDGKISAFPGRDGEGSVDLEVCLEPATMAALLEDNEFMSYVSETTVKAIEAI
ncbi:hypothetical protein HPP92_019383 [Vanilla planifolia]|uniref:Uncharacterized protein n=1 Tax=Vanilla planifolia TaxID=51239 RepID=A0A835UJ97_VANPL|nr:hypothetical protein HPP92_019383 [Vanilla planifolia]